MKAPDAALVRARAKAPLPDLQALHLSSAELGCLRGLDGCLALRSLYANANVLKSIDGLMSLRRLWRVDLSDNFVQQVQPLASFAALGFVNLERNQLTFQDLVRLRDVHIVELRVSGNRPLVSAALSTTEYRMKVVALLPYVWILDGHYITVQERAEALDTYDSFVQQLLTQTESSSSLRFGSTSDLWGGSSLVLGDDLTSPVQEDALKLLKSIEKQPTRQPEQQDLYRLRAVAAIHDSESDVHNTHAHFAPLKHSPTARSMPKIRLHQALALSLRTRLELSVLLATHLSFPLPRKLLSETLTISLLTHEGEGVASCREWIDELTQLSPYGHVALVSAMRRQTLEEINASHRNHQAAQTPLDTLIWGSLPTVIPTLIATERQTRLVDCDTPDQAYVQRCAFAVSLLIRATSFPETEALASIHASSLAELLEAARLASMQVLESVGFACPSVLLTNGSAKRTSWKQNKLEREYRRPWREPTQSDTDKMAPGSCSLSSPALGLKRRRLPRPGEWLELKAKLFLRVSSVSTDGMFLTASGASAGMTGDSSNTITLRVDQIERISSSMWRLVGSDEQLLAAILSQLGQTPSKARLGKLHRDSEGYHRHGAARNQGFPNRSVSCGDLRGVGVAQEELMGMVGPQPQPVELFSSADTLDANYVLTSPALVALQNACATRSFAEHQLAVGGLWKPIQSACFQVVQDNNHPTDTPTSKPKNTRLKKRQAPPVADDWLALQRDMQALLGIRPEARDVECFITSVPADEEAERHENNAASTASDTPLPVSSPPPFQRVASIQKPPTSTAKPKKLAALSWHHVATKPQLLVASAALSSPLNTNDFGTASSPLAATSTGRVAVATSAQPQPTALATPQLRPGSSSSSSSRMTRSPISLPSLPIQFQK